MEEYIELLKQRASIIRKGIASAEKDESRFPAGRMRVSQSGNQIRYYYVAPRSSPPEASQSPKASRSPKSSQPLEASQPTAASQPSNASQPQASSRSPKSSQPSEASQSPAVSYPSTSSASRTVSPPHDYSGRYITTANIGLAKKLAQKDYNESFLKTARSEIRILERSIRLLEQKNTDTVYDNLDPRRQRLVVPYIMPDDLYEKQWKDQAFKTNQYMPEAKIYDTRNGEKVRSKTEAILADMFLELGIPYHYEQALLLDKGILRYPDFTLLKTKTREEFYLEHFGLLDDEEYRNKSLHKLDEYRNNGIFLGKNLIITYESSECPFDILGTRNMIKALFQL